MTESWSEYRYRVTGAEPVTPVVRRLWLEPLGEALRFRAGQYVLLADPDCRVPQRSYSVANAPRPHGRVSLLVTRIDGGATSTWAHGLRAGDEVVLDGPYGTFVIDPGRRGPVLLLAAGSGLAPARALIEALLDAGDRPVTLFFSARTVADTIDRARFERWQDERAGFRYLLTLTRDPHAARHGRIPALLPYTFERLSGWEVFASGPPGFVVACAGAARALGAAGADVHTEEFFTDPAPWVIEPTRPLISASADR